MGHKQTPCQKCLGQTRSAAFLTWLQNTFEALYMHNQQLKADIVQLDSGSYQGKTWKKWKDNVKKSRRDAFKAWKWSLLLNSPLLLTLLRHGMQEPRQMCEFVLAVQEERQETARRYTPSAEEVEKLRNEALEARLNLRST